MPKRDLKKELSQLYYLNREIEQLQHQLDDLKRAATETGKQQTFDSVQGSAIAFPYILHSITVSGVSETDRSKKLRLQAEIKDIIKRIEINKEKCIYEYNRLNCYISSVDDSEMRQILTLRYVNGLSWQQVAFSIGYQDESVPRKRHDRFLKMTEKSE